MSPSSQCVPQHVPNSSSLYPISLALSNPMEELTIYPFWDCPKLDFIFFGDDRPIKDAHDNKKKVELWESPQLINMSHTLEGGGMGGGGGKGQHI